MSAAETYSHKKFSCVSFADMDLSGKDLSHSTFHNCNFDRANLKDTNFEYSDLTGSSLVGTVCTHTNFKDAILAASNFNPSDCFGMTMTFHCPTFKNMRMGQMHWCSWLVLLLSSVPYPGPIKEDLHGNLVAYIGAERYLRLKALFERREL